MMPRGSVTPRAMNTAAIIQRSAAAVKHITQKYHHRAAKLIWPPRRSNGPWRAARHDMGKPDRTPGAVTLNWRVQTPLVERMPRALSERR